MRRASIIFLLMIPALFSFAAKKQNTNSEKILPSNHLSDPFAMGWMLVDTNGDGIADAINGRIVVPENPSAAMNTAAANLAARLAYGSTGLNLPLVVSNDSIHVNVPRIQIGYVSVPVVSSTSDADSFLAAYGYPLPKITNGEGAVLDQGRDISVLGNDSGLAAAADAYSSRAPYQWKVPGDKLSAIADAVNVAAHGTGAKLVAVTYFHGEQGIHRAFVSA